MSTSLLKAYSSLQFLGSVLAHRWWAVAAILILCALLGRRVYCRFVCPLGLAQSLVRAFLGPRRICSRLDAARVFSPAQASVRFAVLAATVAAGLTGLGWQWLDPYAIACRAVTVFFAPEFDALVAAFALVPALAVLTLAFFSHGRIWCHWVCPVGTVLALVGSHPLWGDRMTKSVGCAMCRRCCK